VRAIAWPQVDTLVATSLPSEFADRLGQREVEVLRAT